MAKKRATKTASAGKARRGRRRQVAPGGRPGCGGIPGGRCGDVGGVTEYGEPCPLRKYFRRNVDPDNLPEDGGLCVWHCEEKALGDAELKAAFLMTYDECFEDSVAEICRRMDPPISVSLVYKWRAKEPGFAEQMDRIKNRRFAQQASEVGTSLYRRAKSGEASGTETVYFLGNRGPEDWRDVRHHVVKNEDSSEALANLLGVGREDLPELLRELRRAQIAGEAKS